MILIKCIHPLNVRRVREISVDLPDRDVISKDRESGADENLRQHVLKIIIMKQIICFFGGLQFKGDGWRNITSLLRFQLYIAKAR